MNVNVHSIHFNADAKLVEFIKTKLSKLTQFNDSILSGDVFLRLEHDGDNRENKVVEIRLAVPGNDLFAKRQGKTFEEAAVNTIEALRSQAEKTKEKSRAI
ncbi:MAG: ribosome-associated translation inhibitor RaiA [Flavobacteriales bacterium]|nr:ribosome-associated translation inhibitor RaiA [Flavobacteriales bacterium]MBK6943332.1 ribosome-associated translation inhibitor RaiA [Flavobacteriales bacterium]MBK7240791.1 ribosome-associated translation inhibitor RaiA [Flavobacteriales bacterium]MBK7296593.1 ribosome-associated translation inhibitor RaiA [Flavobacteriales bacterium]MBK9536138.1 ribosome-associated translation inhibitor RaiA [Flavobacteriales bacterium]